MDIAHSLSTPMVMQSLDEKKDPFCPRFEEEEIVSPEVPYLSVVDALMYLANYAHPNIDFVVNLLAKFSSTPT